MKFDYGDEVVLIALGAISGTATITVNPAALVSITLCR
jgi:hypothetical protein